MDSEAKQRALLRLVEQLLERGWIATARMAIPTLRVAFLALLATAVQSVSPDTLAVAPSALPALLRLSSHCCDGHVGPSFPGIGFASMRQRAAAILLQTVLSVPLDHPELLVHATTVSLQLLSDVDGGVQESALRVLGYALHANAESLGARVDLSAVRSASMAALLRPAACAGSVTHPTVRALALRLVLALDERCGCGPGNSGASPAFSLDDERVWQMLLSGAHSEHVALKVAALPCMGRALRHSLSLSQDALLTAPVLLERAARWVECLSEYSSDLQVPELRHACWRSIAESAIIAWPSRSDLAFAVWRVLVPSSPTSPS